MKVVVFGRCVDRGNEDVVKHLMTAEGSSTSKTKEELVSGGNQTLIYSKDFSEKYI